jgi:hypothetical protein
MGKVDMAKPGKISAFLKKDVGNLLFHKEETTRGEKIMNKAIICLAAIITLTSKQ